MSIFSCIQDRSTTKSTNSVDSLALNKVPIKSDPSRYLAHAGGEIEGQRYTNSLEALDLNYALGFRVFEIDIITTSDEHLVCAHDWDSWQRFTGYEGDLPPTLDAFLAHKIKNKFTPLSLAQLNTWFGNHPDATVFTDKINNPQALSATFTYKSQLIMKLVSNSAVNRAKMLGIKFALAENLLDYEDEELLQKLQDNHTEYIVIARTSIEKHRALLQQIKNAGIKTYASHVNFQKGKDEMYMFANEMPYIYGFYADVWDFQDE